MLSNLLFADRNSAVNVWLRENLLVLSAILAVLGVVVLVFGIVGLRAGTTRDKRGNQLSGGTALTMSIMRLVVGIGLIGGALFVAVKGAG